MNLLCVIILTIGAFLGHCDPTFIVDEAPALEISDSDMDLLARVVMSEASTEPFDCKQAVAAVVLNRYRSGKYGNNLSNIINAPNQFSTQDNGEPTEECYEAVRMAIEYPNCFPADMLYFKTGGYFSKYNDYAVIGKTYFSTVIDHDILDTSIVREEFVY